MARRILLSSLVTAVAGLGLAASAQAATVIGQSGPPAECSPANFGGQVQLSGGNYTVPFDGTITSWTAGSDAPGVQTKLLVLQPVSGDTFNVVAKSDFGTFTLPVQTFPANIPVHAGQVIGEWGKLCLLQTGGSEILGDFSGPEPPIGASPSFDPGPGGNVADLSATVEPAPPAPTPTPTPPAIKHKKKCKKHKKHKRSAESAKKKCKKKKKR
jgi:hypothetical protein